MLHDHISEYAEDFMEVEEGILNNFFVGNIPGLYFLTVELSLFMQCFYVAMYCTQLAPIALKSTVPAFWIIILFVPIFYNYFLVRHVISQAVLLHSALHLDKEVVATVCQEMIYEVSESVSEAGSTRCSATE